MCFALVTSLLLVTGNKQDILCVLLWLHHYFSSQELQGRWRLKLPASSLFTQRLFRRRSNKTSKLRVTSLCAGNSPVTGEFPAQMASNTENVSIWWRHHGSSRINTGSSINCLHFYWFWFNTTWTMFLKSTQEHYIYLCFCLTTQLLCGVTKGTKPQQLWSSIIKFRSSIMGLWSFIINYGAP